MKQPKISVFRKMTAGGSHAPQWVRVFSGYDTVEQAKAAVMRQAYSTHFGSTWRIVQRDGEQGFAWDSTILPRQQNMAWSEAKPDSYYVHRNSGDAVFVKSESYFLEQKGDILPWGLCWTKVEAFSIEDARHVGERVLPMTVRPRYG